MCVHFTCVSESLLCRDIRYVNVAWAHSRERMSVTRLGFETLEETEDWLNQPMDLLSLKRMSPPLCPDDEPDSGENDPPYEEPTAP
jgi:hypothetical protein